MDEDTAILQSEDEWDFEAAERQRAPRGNRAIVSVGFKPTDFAVVAAAARKRDQPVSQFIREAALDRARALAGAIGGRPSITIIAAKADSRLTGSRGPMLGYARAFALR